ncbi:MAG: phosphomannomutase/phosphoglucomutase [Patescibacteria group bacterium]|jgi:phosphomannomutase
MNNLNPKVFKAYDIRGIYPTELNEETAYVVGQAYAQMTKVKKIFVGRDMRLGSPELTKQFIAGVLSQGVDVDDIGLVPIDAVYFSTGHFKYGGGVMTTASHNPKEYNGFKMTVLDNGIRMVRGQEVYEFIKGKTFTPTKKPGILAEKNIWKEYIEHIFSFIDKDKIKPFKIVVDAGNGMAGKVMPMIFEKLPCQLIPLNFKLDGNFPAHPSNPLLPESQVQIKKMVVEEKADFGIIMDGDTDRLFFVTENGDFVRADTTLLLLAKYFLEREPGAVISYNAICSKAVPQRITEWGGKPIRTPVGFVNVSKAIRDNNGVMGGEVSAHYCFRKNYFGDSGFIAVLILLMLISEKNQKLSEAVEGLNPYSRADETNITVNNIPEVIQAVKNHFADAKQDELDGVTIEYKDWWVNVRASNTEPLLRITVEGDTKEIMLAQHKKVVGFIQGVAK